MLVSFSVSNFRSFAAEQTFSLVASKRLGSDHENHAVPIPASDEKALRAGVIYGANGAGKSNLLDALRYAVHIALTARQDSRGTGRNPFRLADLRDQPSSFDFQFIANNKLYRFGFSVDDERIAEEWLVHVVGSKEKPVYERRTTSEGEVEIDAPGLKNGSEKLAALVTVGGRHNQSFLATVHAILEPKDLGEELSEVIEWFDHLVLIGPDTTHNSLGDFLARNPQFQQFAGDFLRASSTGIEGLRAEKKELSQDEAQGLIPKSVLTMFLENVDTEHTGAVHLPGGEDLLIQRKADGNHFYRVFIQAVHKHATQKETTFNLSDESDGTRRLLELMPALYPMQSGRAVYFIDEIDRSMHPTLVHKFIEYFLGSCSGASCQIIVTTHESHLLDLDLLRRDEIWFAEKDQAGATHLYSLTDFNVRKDLHIQKGYLEGRFGAVPFLGEIDHLIERLPGTEPCP